MTIRKRKSIVLIAHDQKKRELTSWCNEHEDILSKHFLYGTGTTVHMITDNTDPPVKRYNSGPLGSDQQIGVEIMEREINLVIFFSDPSTARSHNPDVKALLWIIRIYDISIASSKVSADSMITFPLMDEECEHDVMNFKQNIIEGANMLQYCLKLWPNGRLSK